MTRIARYRNTGTRGPLEEGAGAGVAEEGGGLFFCLLEDGVWPVLAPPPAPVPCRDPSNRLRAQQVAQVQRLI